MEESKVHFKYVFDKDYNPDYVNGVYGGINTDGNLIAHFYCERFPLPYEVEASIDESGSLSNDEDVTKPEKHKIIRKVQSGILMDRDTAMSFYNWLGNYLERMEVENNDLRNDK